MERHPNSANAWSILGRAFSHVHLWEDSVAAFQQSLKLQPEQKETWRDLSASLAYLQKPREAFIALRQAIAQGLNDPAYEWFFISLLLAKVGDIDNAIAASREAVKLEPNDGYYWWNLGTNLEEAEKSAEAKKAHRQAVKLEPRKAHFWHSLARACFSTGNTKEAIEAAQKAAEIEPKEAIYWRLLAKAFTQAGRKYEADVAAQKAIILEKGK
jgi:Flp pilus assembly protein TadD